MSLRRNIIANYATQIYVTAAGIIMVPQYIKYMGAEAYGLVGFYVMLQAWFNLLDMGLTPTMARESARFNGGAISALEYRQLTRALERVFMCVALFGGLVLFFISDWLAEHWLNSNNILTSDIATSLRIIAIIIALRWMCGLYRGVVTGAEKLVWLSGFNSAMATARFILILPLLILVSPSPLTFFSFQLIISITELSILTWMAYHLLPNMPNSIQFEWSPLKPVLKFSLSIAFTSSAWVLVTQTDKLVLSKILSLSDYGYFTVAVLVAGGISTLNSPLSGAILPRLASLEAQSKQNELIEIYRRSTRITSTIVGGSALFVCLFSSEILLAWTGNSELTHYAAPILSIYALGNSILASAAFPYYMQYAKGDLRLHVYGNILFVLILVPSLILAASKYGGLGAAYAWLGMNVIYMIFWTPLVHKKFIPNLHTLWLFNDFLKPIATSLIVLIPLRTFIQISNDRLYGILQLIAIFIAFASILFLINKKSLNRNKVQS